MARPAVTIVKLGGNILEDPAQRSAALAQVARLHGSCVLVHGGGNAASSLAARLGIAPRMVHGRRITDRETLDVVTMVYGGLVNRSLVAELQSLGCNACGLTGADLDVIRAERRPVGEIDYGYVGDITAVNAAALSTLFEKGVTPVIAPLTHDGGGGLLNTNADTIAASIASALAHSMEVRLLYCFDRGGVLDRDGNVLPRIDLAFAEELTAAGVITAGMLPKLHNAFEALHAGAAEVILCSAEHLSKTAAGEKGYGTEVRL
ncbi:MAG: acetylglutamate kinase [Bacteroidetes bacterium]|nr:acetylglutamate kinase [Bacteroidota bacterium]